MFLLTGGITSYCSAQKLRVITYESSQVRWLDSSRSYTHQNERIEYFMHYLATVSNDTASFLFYGQDMEKLGKRNFKKKMGDKIVHHSIFNDFNARVSWDEVNYPPSENLLVERPFDTATWKLFDVRKTILGHDCKMAMSISATNDSTIVWYSNDTSKYKAKLLFNNAPGLILAAESQMNNILMKYRAINLFEYDGELFFPAQGIKITAEEFRRRRANDPQPQGQIFKLKRRNPSAGSNN